MYTSISFFTSLENSCVKWILGILLITEKKYFVRKYPHGILFYLGNIWFVKIKKCVIKR